MTNTPQPPDRWPTVPTPASEPARARRTPDQPGSGVACTACGSEQFEDGFLEDSGESSRGYIRWIVGPLERGIFGGARRMGKTRMIVTGKRCAVCGHVELFATERL